MLGKNTDAKLNAAIWQAIELQGSPYFRDALEAMLDAFWAKQAQLDWERAQEIRGLVALVSEGRPVEVQAAA